MGTNFVFKQEMIVRLMLTVQRLCQCASLPRANKGTFYFQPSLHKMVSEGFHVNNTIDKNISLKQQNMSIVLDSCHQGDTFTEEVQSLCVKMCKSQLQQALDIFQCLSYNSLHRFLTITHFRSTLLVPLSLMGTHDR